MKAEKFIFTFPKYNRWDSQTEKDKRNETIINVIGDVSKFLDKYLPEDWKEYISIIEQTTTIIIAKGKVYSCYSRDNKLKSFKEDSNCVIDSKVIEKIKGYIEDKKESDIRDSERKNLYQYLWDKISPVLISFKSERVKISFDGTFNIIIQIQDGKNSWEYSSLSINRQGVISEAQKSQQSFITTISEANKFISENKPVMDELNIISARIKSQLPKEYFI